MQKTPFTSQAKIIVVSIIGVAVLLVAIALFLMFSATTDAPANLPTSQLNTSAMEQRGEPIKMAKITIEAKQANQDYLLHFVDVPSGEKVLAVFIKRGQRKIIELPVSDYHIKFASGAQWQNEKTLFGEDTDIRQTTIPMRIKPNRTGASYNVLHLNSKLTGQLQPATM